MFLFITIFVIISAIFLGLITFTKNPKSVSNRLLLILTIVISLWSFTNYFSINAKTANDTLFWIRLVMVITASMWPVIFLLSHAFPHNSLKLKRYKLYLIIFYVIFVQFLSFTKLIFTKVEFINDTYTPVPGPGMPLFMIDVVGFLLLTIFTLHKKTKVFKGIEKIQLKYLILGLSLPFTLSMVTNFLLVVIFKITSLVALGPIFNLFFIGFISYAIVKHRFLDIRLVVARTVAYTLLIVILGIIYASGLFLIGSIFFPSISTNNNQLLVSTLLALFLVFTFQPLRRYLEKVTDGIFFKARYDPQLFLAGVGKIMASKLSLSDLAGSILQELVSKIKTASAFLILTRNSSIIWVKGEGQENHPDFEEKQIYHLIQSVSKTSTENILVFEEMYESEEKETMRKHNLNIVLPLVVKDEIIGAILLSEKSSGDIYSVRDIEVLKILAPEVAVAVRNSLSYEEIKRFNITLEQEIKQATKRLEHANLRLKELDRLKDEFVFVASHELRTPMTAIKSYLWMALNRPPQTLDPKLKHYLEIAYGSTDRLIKLVQDMLTISRIEGKRYELKIVKFDLREIIKQIYEELVIKAKENRVHFEIEKCSEEMNIYGDKDKIREVFQNLIGNALKFTPEEGRVTVSFKKNDKEIETSISDTGPGIAEEDITKLFQKFNRLSSSYAKINEISGTGLGLYIAKQIVTLHKGKIEVKSTVGKGSVFTVKLPEHKT